METSAMLKRHSPILKRGILNQKKSLVTTRKFAYLCAPTGTDDVNHIYATLFENFQYANQNSYDPRTVPVLGNLAFSAIRDTPVLILMSPNQVKKFINNNKKNPETASFIHFNEVGDYSDENQLNLACHFSLLFPTKEFKFNCLTSIEYQEWIYAIDSACRITKKEPLASPPDFSSYYRQQANRMSFVKERIPTPTPSMNSPIQEPKEKKIVSFENGIKEE